MKTARPFATAPAWPLAVHPGRRRFGRRIRRFVAYALSGTGRLPNLPAMEAGRNLMKRTPTLIALGVALAVNAAALAGLNAAMTEGAQRAQTAQVEPARLVIVGKKPQTETASVSRGSRS